MVVKKSNTFSAPTVSSAAVNLIYRQLSRFNIDENEALRKANLSHSRLGFSLHERLSLEQENLFWKSIKELNPDPLLHIKLADSTQMGDFFWGDLLFASAADAYTAIRLFEMFAATISESWIIKTETHDNTLKLIFNLTLDREYGQELIEFGMVNSFKRISDISERKIFPTQVYVKRSFSAEVDKIFLKIFNCPISYDSGQDCIEFSAQDLFLPTKKKEANAKKSFSEVANAFVNLPSLKVGVHARHYEIFKLLILRNVLSPSTLKNFSLNDFSQNLKTNSRELQRTFKERGLTFRDVFLDLKMIVASFYLKSTDLPINEIGQSLGYSDDSNFLRAFRKKFGVTPNIHRKKTK